MKYFKAPFWKATPAPTPIVGALLDGLFRFAAPEVPHGRPKGISYPLKPDFIRTFANSGQPFLTYYEINDLAGWCRDYSFAPDHVDGYADDIGQSYTVWTRSSTASYRRHIFRESVGPSIRVEFAIPALDHAAWFPLQITLLDDDGIYFQCNQKLVVDALDGPKPRLTSWKKVPGLRASLPRLHAMS